MLVGEEAPASALRPDRRRGARRGLRARDDAAHRARSPAEPHSQAHIGGPTTRATQAQARTRSSRSRCAGRPPAAEQPACTSRAYRHPGAIGSCARAALAGPEAPGPARAGAVLRRLSRALQRRTGARPPGRFRVLCCGGPVMGRHDDQPSGGEQARATTHLGIP